MSSAIMVMARSRRHRPIEAGEYIGLAEAVRYCRSALQAMSSAIMANGEIALELAAADIALSRPESTLAWPRRSSTCLEMAMASPIGRAGLIILSCHLQAACVGKFCCRFSFEWGL
jgi:hypothetical protein